MVTEKQIKDLNDDYYTHYPEAKNKKWAGCNFYINQGKIQHEPIGTAQSMHDCEGCEKYDKCLMKKDHPTWLYNKEVAEELDNLFNQMNTKVQH